MSEIALRDYQQKFIDDIRTEMKNGFKRICAVAPCGSGKTIMTGWMIRETAQNGKRVIFMVHRKELIEQTSKTFSQLGIEHGIIMTGVKPNYEPLVQIASVQTLIKRLEKVPPPELLIVDECHHILAKSYLAIINHWESVFVIGVTATPLRLGGITLNDVFKTMILGPTVSGLIREKFLTNFEYYCSENPIDTSKLHIKYGEYIEREIFELMDRPSVLKDVVKSYEQFANGKQAIVYCVNVKHSEDTAETFNFYGITAAHVDGSTRKSERERIIEEFREGKITVLCNAELFGEGFDVPNCDCVILNRPTHSLTLYIQQSMRCMRPDPNNPDKIAIILDHVGNYKRFGPVDKDRKWSLEPNIKKDNERKYEFGERNEPIKICPICGEDVPIAALECPNCGYEFEVEEETRELEKFFDSRNKDYSNDRVENEIVRAPTFEELIEKFRKEAELRNYKPGWIYYQLIDHAETYEHFKMMAQCLHYKEGWAWHKWQDKMKGVDLKKSTKNKPNVNSPMNFYDFFPNATL